jgi:outer membrane protein OmpA-like peptidoglycan-associated protein
MKIFNKFFFYLFSFISTGISGQQYYDIKIPGNDYYKKCGECLTLISNKPKEIQFGIQSDKAYNLYFTVTRKEWYDLMIKKSGDGIAIDIVSKDRYDCLKDKPAKDQIIRGELQRPLYLKELKQNTIPSRYGEVVIKMGMIPEKFRDKEVEYNLVFIKDKYFCHYNAFFDIKSYRWDLLDMGLYFDTLTYKSQFDTSLTEQEKYILQEKVLRFEIPFERNKAEYSNDDIKPLYDSLKLTDFNIQKIIIRAYSSIEGNEDRNIELQKERAQSIVNALQSYQKPTIITEILATENWVDFLNDISLTSFGYLSDLSKTDIKEKLRDKKLQQELEPYFQKHRKAVIILELQKKNIYETVPVSELLELFSKSISERNLEQAIDIQNSIFEKVRNHEIPVNYIDKLEIPEKNEYSLLLNKNSIFKYLMNESDVYNTYKELTELQDLMPKDNHIRYNICAMKFKVWLLGGNAINPADFKKEINDLKNFGIAQNLIKRMLINYEIIMCEYYMMQGDFINKDKSLKYIYSNYQYVPLSDADYLSLAQYFASYAKYDWATKLLEKKVKSVDVDEDLLFYYLNLTLIDEKLTKRKDYRTIMLNAYNLNKSRYCELFNAFGQGGVTFQLLENEYLRKTYCESCK